MIELAIGALMFACLVFGYCAGFLLARSIYRDDDWGRK